MVLIGHHVWIHSHSLIFNKRTASAAALRMLSSSSSTSSINPNPALAMTKSNSELPSKSTNFPHFPDSAQPPFPSPTIHLSQSFATRSFSIGATAAAAAEGLECPLVVVSFYKFADFPDHADLRKPLKELCERLVESPSPSC